MKFGKVKSRKAELFSRIMSDKYAGVETPASLVKEYRFLQREEKRLAKNHKRVG